MEGKNFLQIETPSVLKSDQANWVVKDDLGNEVQEGEQVFILENGATIHVGAAEDYLIEKLGAKVAKTGVTDVFLLADGAWISTEDIEDYFIKTLGAQVFQRVAFNSAQK